MVECYATLIGPGGAELTRRGTQTDPLALDVPAAPLERSELDEALPYLLAGVGALVAGAAAAAIGLTVAPPPTRVNTPTP